MEGKELVWIGYAVVRGPDTFIQSVLTNSRNSLAISSSNLKFHTLFDDTRGHAQLHPHIELSQ